MTDADVETLILVGAAAGVAAVAVPVGVRRFRRSGDPAGAGDERAGAPHHPTTPGDAPRDPGDAATGEVVSVRLVQNPADETELTWRVHTGERIAATSLEIFSYRERTTGEPGPWRHELMDAPLLLAPGVPAHIDGPRRIDGATYDVMIGWTIERDAGAVQDSMFLTTAADEHRPHWPPQPPTIDAPTTDR